MNLNSTKELIDLLLLVMAANKSVENGTVDAKIAEVYSRIYKIGCTSEKDDLALYTFEAAKKLAA